MINLITMDDFDFENKTVIIRVDFNSPLDSETKIITDDTRIRRHAKTIKELMDKGGKVVIIAHQGRPGSHDFSTLQQHSIVLSKILGKSVRYVSDIFGEAAKSEIKNLKRGNALLIENVRMFLGEMKKLTADEHAKSELVKNLAPLADVYVNDGFAVAHRAHASIVGFPTVLPNVVGRVLERELKVLDKVKKAEDKPCIYVMGGAKADDAAAISDYVLGHGTADYVLTGGVIGQLFLFAQGVDIGDINVRFLEKKKFVQYIPKIKELFKKYNGKILLPEDFGIDVNGKRKDITLGDLPTQYSMFDIGLKTVKKYTELLKTAKIIVLSGPMGVYERKEFILGTKRIFEVIANSDVFSVVGGGNTLEAVKKLGLSEKISYISTGGGALMEFLTGKILPGVKALEKQPL
ncbi:phosphoglycerate kinase [Candidatus Bathyarchaeota archaeon]|nr:MAG: phosphoglycerate kinase [Candidatus Bathyarchaeota archaeon]